MGEGGRFSASFPPPSLRCCATPTGTGDSSSLPTRREEPILWRVGAAPGRRNARKVVGATQALKVRAIPSGDRASDWRAQKQSKVGWGCQRGCQEMGKPMCARVLRAPSLGNVWTG